MIRYGDLLEKMVPLVALIFYLGGNLKASVSAPLSALRK